MYQQTVNEKDWKMIRAKLPGWQEAYMERLTGSGKGTCVITCTAADGSGVNATCTIKVK